MPHWNDLTNEERRAIIAAVFHDDTWDAAIAIDVYNAIRKVMLDRGGIANAIKTHRSKYVGTEIDL